jgi:rhomboid protease GluP
MIQPDAEAQPIPTRTATLPLYRPQVAWVLLALNIAVFIIPEVLGITGAVQDLGAKSNAAIQGGEYYRFFTAMFLHAGLTHIMFNAFALYSLGLDVERIYGHLRFLLVYLIAGLGGGVASYALSPNDSVGASGAIFGLIGALGAFFYQSRKLFGEMSRQQIGSLIFVTLINLGIGFTTPRIDNYAHIGGLVTGALAGLLLAPRLAVDQERGIILRETRNYAWPGIALIAGALIAAAMLIQPPIR